MTDPDEVPDDCDCDLCVYRPDEDEDDDGADDGFDRRPYPESD